MWYWILRNIGLVLLKIFFRLKTEGRENLPVKANFIVVANHCSYLDPLAIESSIPEKIYCLAERFLYKKPFLRWYLKRKEAIPTGRGSSEKAVELLEQNKIVGLFPEGRISRDGKLKEFRRGVALLAAKTGRPIVPCAILGTFEALPYQAKFPKFSRIKVKIGKPVYILKEFDEVIDDVRLQEGIIKVRNKIQEMLNAG